MSKKHNYNYYQAQDLEREAIQWAQDKLSALGVSYPVIDSNLSIEQNYKRLEDYAIQESHLVREFYKARTTPKRDEVSPGMPPTDKSTYYEWLDK